MWKGETVGRNPQLFPHLLAVSLSRLVKINVGKYRQGGGQRERHERATTVRMMREDEDSENNAREYDDSDNDVRGREKLD